MTKKYPIITEIRKGKFSTDKYRQLENDITQFTTERGEKTQTRQVTRFLKLPKTIFGKTRWEENRIETTFINWFNPLLVGPRLGWSEWTSTKWI